MTQRDEFHQRARTIETVVKQFEGAADPALRTAAKDLVQALMELHGAALERVMEILHEAGEPGGALIEKLGRDEMVLGLLLLYGIHPKDVQTRVLEALDKECASLRSHNASAELVSVDEKGVVKVRFEARAAGCGSATSSLKASLETAIQEAAPDVTGIVIEDVSEALRGSAFVPLSVLQSSLAGGTLPTAQAEQVGD